MSDAEIPTRPLYEGHEEVYDRYVELHDEQWVRKVDRHTSVYEFVRCYLDDRRRTNDSQTPRADKRAKVTNNGGRR